MSSNVWQQSFDGYAPQCADGVFTKGEYEIMVVARRPDEAER